MDRNESNFAECRDSNFSCVFISPESIDEIDYTKMAHPVCRTILGIQQPTIRLLARVFRLFFTICMDHHEGHFTPSKKRTRFFQNKRIFTDFWWIFLANKRIFAKGVRVFLEWNAPRIIITCCFQMWYKMSLFSRIWCHDDAQKKLYLRGFIKTCHCP